MSVTRLASATFFDTDLAAICVHPPYPVLVVVFILAGYGNGLGDSGWYVVSNIVMKISLTYISAGMPG